MTPDQESAWEDRFSKLKIKGGTLDGTFRLSRQAYWRNNVGLGSLLSFAQRLILEAEQRYMLSALSVATGSGWKCAQAGSSELSGDDLMKCLSPFVGCAPCSVAPKSSQHFTALLLSNHKFGKWMAAL
jgi:hypothetical protein